MRGVRAGIVVQARVRNHDTGALAASRPQPDAPCRIIALSDGVGCLFVSGPEANGIGQSVRRREDGRLLVGRGRYVTDLPFDGALHVAVVRSPHAHARVVHVDAAAARALPGVRAVMVLDDLPELRGALPAPAVP